MKTTRNILVFILVMGILVLFMAGCGSKKFEVETVLMNQVIGRGYAIKGTYDGKTYKLPLNSFKDCKAGSISFPSQKVELSGTGDGYMAVSGGINLTLTDSKGESRTVFIDKGVKFDAIREGDTLQLLLPQG